MSTKRPLAREVRAAEVAYANAMQTWGENNLVTVRAHIRWTELKTARETIAKKATALAAAVLAIACTIQTAQADWIKLSDSVAAWDIPAIGKDGSRSLMVYSDDKIGFTTFNCSNPHFVTYGDGHIGPIIRGSVGASAFELACSYNTAQK